MKRPARSIAHDRAARSALLARINHHYPTRDDEIDLGAWRFNFTRVADPQRVLDDVVAAEDARIKNPHGQHPTALQVPYWAELWESSFALAPIIAQRVSPATTVLDLGCGMGCTGAMAAHAGGAVLLADLEPLAVLLARLNTWPWRERIRARRLDWQRDQLTDRFELILGGDILYERNQWPHLHHFWLRHLLPGGMVLLGEPGRNTGDAFAPWAHTMGWLCKETPVELTPALRNASKGQFRTFELTLDGTTTDSAR